MKPTLSTLLIAGAVAAAVYRVRPPVPATPPDLQIAATAQALARGRYLYGLSGCDSCHAPRDFSRFAGPVSAATGMGGEYAPNLTSDGATGLGRWSDAEIVRAIREGIGRDGEMLDSGMPYRAYSAMSDEDVFALTAYLRSLPPTRNQIARAPAIAANALWRRADARQVANVAPIDRNDQAAYGRYLATIGRCLDCHGREDGPAGAGGRIFRFAGAAVASANLTPDPHAGIGAWSESDFVDRFHRYRGYADRGAPAVGPGGFTVMPWLSLCRLETADLRAIFSFLRTLPPSSQNVNAHPVTGRANLLRLNRNF